MARKSRAAAAPRTPARSAATRRPVLIPIGFALALAAFTFLPAAQANPNLSRSLAGASAVLLLGLGILWVSAPRRTLTVDVQLRAQHYLQACAQGTVLLYWGYYWRPVYDALPLLAAQLVFAYAFDMLLSWSRRDSYTLGFGPFPVIFSINLFLWFKQDWFYLQFLMIAIGFAAKELIRWERDGRLTHIFNPSSFPLALVSLVLIATGNTSMTWGVEIATTQFNPPNIYLLLFLIGLPGQFLFGVTTMTASAVVTTYLFGLIYLLATGTYFFIDSYIPIAVFLGMHLLFTDPSTSPRTELGRILFGVMYGLGNIVLYELFKNIGVPAFYDKLLPVPLMNLSVRAIDRAVRSSWLQRFDTARLAPALVGRSRHLAFIGVWASVFVVLSVTDGVGDNHPGHRVPFWQNACHADRRDACDVYGRILDTYCSDGSGWACNEAGVLRTQGRRPDVEHASADFVRACQLGFVTGCQNHPLPPGAAPQAGPPSLPDYPVILRTGKGALPDVRPLALFTRACEQGWMSGCESLAGAYLLGQGVPRDTARAADLLTEACDGGLASACSNLGIMYYRGDGITRDLERSKQLLTRACDLGFASACQLRDSVIKEQSGS